MKKILIITGICLIGVYFMQMTIAQIKTLYGNFANTFGSIYNVEPNLILAVIKQESGGNPFAFGLTNDFGLMQITQPALTDYNRRFNKSFTLFDVFINPKLNINIGSWYLAEMINLYNGNLEKGITAYNAGQGNVNRNNYTLDYYNSVIFYYNQLTS